MVGLGFPLILILKSMCNCRFTFYILSLFGCLSDSKRWGRRKKISVVNKILLYVDGFLFIRDSALAILPQMEGKVRTNPVFSLNFPRQSVK